MRIVIAGAVGLTAYALMNHLMLSDIIDHFDEREVYKSLIYSGWLLCGFTVLMAFMATAPLPLLAAAVLIFFVSLAINYSYVVISGRPFSLDVVEWLGHEVSQLHNAWGEFDREILWAIVQAGVFIAALMMARAILHGDGALSSRLMRRRSWLIAGSAFAAFHASAAILQPPQMMAETNILVFGVPALFASTPALRPLPVAPSTEALAEKVVLLVDESVTYAIYRQEIARTIRGVTAFDFGEAASIANCSAASNALLRWGVERSHLDLPGYDPRTNPTIWAYAKGAGYRTTLIDGQSTGELQNYLGPNEYALIDEFIPASSGIDSDQRIAVRLHEILKRPGREFVYVVKRGVHFPYEMNYPQDALPADATRAQKYAKAAHYANDGFFSHLIANVDWTRALVIYTSDHGQDLNERSTHCNPHPRDVEYSVPLIALTSVPAVLNLLGNASRIHDRASHLNIFPTLLYAFGYSRQWLESEYGPTLGGDPSPYLVYVSLGWQGPAADRNRHTVDTSQFAKSVRFPRRGSSGAVH